MFLSPTKFAIRSVDAAPRISRSLSSSKQATRSDLRNFDRAASVALRLSPSSGEFSRSFITSFPASELSLPFIHSHTVLPVAPTADLASTAARYGSAAPIAIMARVAGSTITSSSHSCDKISVCLAAKSFSSTSSIFMHTGLAVESLSKTSSIFIQTSVMSYRLIDVSPHSAAENQYQAGAHQLRNRFDHVEFALILDPTLERGGLDRS